MHKNKGTLLLSLDFELMWGVHDKRSIESYGSHIKAMLFVVPRLLKQFDKYGLRATFATVGFLFFDNKQQLLASIPPQTPQYIQQNLSPYKGYIDKTAALTQGDFYHYAYDLLQQIQQYPEQEIASHTFSHYYCLEKGQTLSDFEIDLQAAINIAKQRAISLTSLVFPRNQYNDAYLKIIENKGFTAFRGNEKVWFHKPESQSAESLVKRAFRLLDAYINIGGHHCYSTQKVAASKPFNMPASRFLRPYSSKLRHLETLRLRRIKKSMTHAAKKGLVYHLWWHPHNFGANIDKNFAFLEKILVHYQFLHHKYGFESLTMQALSKKIVTKNQHR